MPRRAARSGAPSTPAGGNRARRQSAIVPRPPSASEGNGTPKSGLTQLIKSARDVMRKDAGLNGDVDRIPQLAWILFLKAFDDLERKREVTERGYRPAIEAPYRWRDWAADPLNGRTGDQLLQFVNAELLPKLRELKGTRAGDPRDVIAAVFKETFNRMLSGYLLRDVVNKVNGVNFASTDDIHTMALVYETMLREMRDAAGDAGEFYTPRPVIRFVVEHVGLRLGERVLDPAVGTGGFLVEALELLRPQVHTVEQWRGLQSDLTGIEKKPMPYLLGVMNLMLHGIERPRVRRDNALGHPVTQIPASAKVDVVITNPPFGGEEEKSIQANFPEGLRTDETALLFLEFIRRSLRPGGRCGMVVPNGLLFGTGVAAKIKQKVLEECELHTIVRLPPGVFAPYTAIPTNIIFFDKTGPTREIWYYEQPLPVGRRGYSKTLPMQYQDFAECAAWWCEQRADRQESHQAWRVPIQAVADRGYDLDFQNPFASRSNERSPSELGVIVREHHVRVGQALDAMSAVVGDLDRVESTPTTLRDALELSLDEIEVEPDARYELLGIYSFGRGLLRRPAISGSDTRYRKLTRVHSGQLVMSRLNGWEGAVAVVESEHEGCVVSSEYPTFNVRSSVLDTGYLRWLCRWPAFWKALVPRGSMVRRKRSHPQRLLDVVLPIPPLEVQRQVAEGLDRLAALEAAVTMERDALMQFRQSVVDWTFRRAGQPMTDGNDGSARN